MADDIVLEDWLNLSDKERAFISSKWNVYHNDGLNIIKSVCAKFRKEYEGNEAVKNINFGIYHGGSWVISVAVKWSVKDKIKLPATYKGFVIQKFYYGIQDLEMRKRAKKQFDIWYKEIKKKYVSEIKNLQEFKDMPESKFYEMAWLMDGMSRYYNPFQDK